MKTYLSPKQVAALGRPGLKHPVTVTRHLEAGTLHGTQRTKGACWSVDLDCVDAFMAGVPCEHKSNVVDLDGRRRTA